MTLTEVMISALVLGIGVLGLAKVQTASSRGLSTTNKRRVAQNLAQQRLEWLATRALEQVATCPGPPSCRTTLTELAPRKTNRDGFMCSRFVDGTTNEEGSASAGSYRVDVAVTEPEGSRQFDDARLLTVAVCYLGGDNIIHEVRAERLVVADEEEE